MSWCVMVCPGVRAERAARRPLDRGEERGMACCCCHASNGVLHHEEVTKCHMRGRASSLDRGDAAARAARAAHGRHVPRRVAGRADRAGRRAPGPPVRAPLLRQGERALSERLRVQAALPEVAPRRWRRFRGRSPGCCFFAANPVFAPRTPTREGPNRFGGPDVQWKERKKEKKAKPPLFQIV